ncbi:eukaryotic translation initiation factor 2-alpha kinase [Diorhabda carinulata]|uniref:eukaryotic translation initiation factor 2-alpha kinase n=1 Tax=Diorhabda carinulata TaxID=1163345 RepID=UPI0025A309A4|nr:eukaryotic translation initiation factor 2-alpha kinase [Diorhabda carinulata]
MKLLIISFSFLNCIFSLNADIPSLPHCSEIELGLLIVSTLDGKISALNSNGSLLWELDTGPGPLLLSNIHNLELNNNGEWIRMIPSLTGTLYKFDGTTLDPIPITAEELLKSSFKYSDDLVIAGGIDVSTYGVGFRTGTFYYECNAVKCSNLEETDTDDVLLVERSTHTIRAIEPRTGNERWNFSVGLHNIKLSKISCINLNSDLFDWNISAIVPEGELKVYVTHKNVEHLWTYVFPSPIVRIWKFSGKDVSEIDLFSLKNAPQVVPDSSIFPSIYLGMHKKQLYIRESPLMVNAIRSQLSRRVTVTEDTSIAKIPWKPIPASRVHNEEDSTALSVLNASEYVNGQGFYLYSESDLNSMGCTNNNTKMTKNNTVPSTVKAKMKSLYYFLASYWRELILMIVTLCICLFLFRLQIKNDKEVIIIEKPIEPQHVSSQQRTSEREGDFSSRYVNEYDTLRCLGKGGFGVVFEVKHKFDECSYAIKRITLPNKEKDRDRVMREVKALAKLEHQNIVRYFCSWVESPPLAWQQEYDRKWLGDKLNESSMNNTAESKVRRCKSISISIDEISSSNFDPDLCNIVTSNNDDDADSFIVFENEHDSKNNSNSIIDVLSQKEVSMQRTNEVSHAGHPTKKIDRKVLESKHHSWNASQKKLITFNNDPPVFLYIQMQLCKKESLKEWLTDHQERDYNFVIDIFSQILDAVEYVHLRGLIHRDLKPSNIFFSLDGQIKVGDFGLVKDIEDAFDLELIKKGTPSSYKGHTVEVGTQLYMSPEQFRSRIYDYKVDIYSLGLIFFELLVPFSTEMERIKLLSDVKESIYPKGFAEKFPDEYALLQNMLCKDPNKRLTTIGIRVRRPFNREDSGYCEDNHYRLCSFEKS